MATLTRRDRGVVAAIAGLLFLVYNTNGREIGSCDSQPSKFAARALLVRGSLALGLDDRGWLALGAVAMTRVTTPVTYTIAVLALAWSIAVAATGAFYHPNARWNADPADVDRHHERLWEWRHNQIAVCWQNGPSPQNFSLLTRDSFRVPPH